MNKLKKLAVSFTLTCVLAVTAFADCAPAVPGQIPTSPCVCAPGETAAPPCAAQSTNDDSPVLGETSGPPALPVADVTDITEAVMWALSLF